MPSLCGLPYTYSIMALQLDAPYSDISGISLWPMSDAASNTALGQNLTIWLHSTADIRNDTNAIACGRGIRTYSRIETFTVCPEAATATYVTIQRFSNATTQLALQEVTVYRRSKRRRPCMHSRGAWFSMNGWHGTADACMCSASG